MLSGHAVTSCMKGWLHPELSKMMKKVKVNCLGCQLWHTSVCHFQKHDYGKVPLSELQQLMTIYPSVLYLAKQTFFYTVQKLSHLRKKNGKSRFHVHFMSKMFLPNIETENPDYHQFLRDLSFILCDQCRSIPLVQEFVLEQEM